MEEREEKEKKIEQWMIRGCTPRKISNQTRLNGLKNSRMQTTKQLQKMAIGIFLGFFWTVGIEKSILPEN